MTRLKLDEQGLIPVIAQDAGTGEVLMFAYANPSAVKRTLESGEAWFYSRSREDLWKKGETSGNVLRVREVRTDCDNDALLFKVEPTGPACHTGARSCFFNAVDAAPEGFDAPDRGPAILTELFALVRERQRTMPEGSYTTRLLRDGVSRCAQKVIEEAGEAGLAAATGDREHLPGELADLLYHSLVMMAAAGVTPEQVWEELRKRRKG